jgi:hypothetical protein
VCCMLGVVGKHYHCVLLLLCSRSRVFIGYHVNAAMDTHTHTQLEFGTKYLAKEYQQE